jgi:hypothetical protein
LAAVAAAALGLAAGGSPTAATTAPATVAAAAHRTVVRCSSIQAVPFSISSLRASVRASDSGAAGRAAGGKGPPLSPPQAPSPTSCDVCGAQLRLSSMNCRLRSSRSFEGMMGTPWRLIQSVQAGRPRSKVHWTPAIQVNS